MTNNKSALSLACAVAFMATAISSAPANAFDGAKVCNKVRTCVLENMEGQEIPQNMKDMLLQQLDSQCLEGYKAEEQKIIDAGLEDEAGACAKDMLALSCAELMKPNQANQLLSCQEFEKKRTAAGIGDPDE